MSQNGQTHFKSLVAFAGTLCIKGWSIQFSEDETKNILFTCKWLIKRASQLDIKCDNNSIKTYPHV